MTKSNQKSQEEEFRLESIIEYDLNMGRTKSLVEAIAPTLDDLNINKKEADQICTALASLEKEPVSNWLVMLEHLMKGLIRETPTGSQAFFDTDDFDWVKDVEARFPLITEEVNTVMSNHDLIPTFQAIQKDQEDLTNDDLWKVVVFRGYGTNVKEIISSFPEIMKTLNMIPGWSTGMISILSPGKKIPVHEGPYAGVLRYHLGLKIPENCGIQVKRISKEWVEGKSLIFDDSFEHRAWNQSSESRAILFVDFLRPLPFPLNVLNKFVVFKLIGESSFIKDTENNHKKYDRLVESVKSTA